APHRGQRVGAEDEPGAGPRRWDARVGGRDRGKGREDRPSRRAGNRGPVDQDRRARRGSAEGRRQVLRQGRLMRRAFWVSLGLGAGATGAIVASRWAKRKAKQVAPATIAREAKGGLLEFSKLVSDSIAEG